MSNNGTIPDISQRAFLGVISEMNESAESTLSQPDSVPTDVDPVTVASFLAGLNYAQEVASQEPEREDGVLWHMENELFSQLQGFASLRARQAQSDGRVAGDITTVEQFREVLYDDHDLGSWIKSFFKWKLFNKHRFDEPPDGYVVPIPDRARIALFGDWGSGRYGAPAIATTLRTDTKPITAMIHLGDVYYCGLREEVASNMLALWPFRDDASNLALNGNHEMYGGGHGLADAMTRFGQPYTYFALQNEHFTIIALDTAVHDGDLSDRQAEWVAKTIAAAGNRRTILLSHHQPCSAFEEPCEKVAHKLEPALTSGRVAAWSFGHEHRCVLFDVNPRWGGVKCRLAGHAGYPAFRAEPLADWQQQAGENGSLWFRFPASKRTVVGGIALGDGNPYVKDNHGKSLEMRYGAHGYAMLELSDANASESFHRPDGTRIFQAPL